MKRLVEVVALLGAVAVTGCGKKGPPLAPLVRIPGPVQTIEARRLGNDVYVSLTIPAANIDGSFPATVASVEVFGYTGHAAPPRGRWTEVGTLVARVEVPPSSQPVTAARRPSPAPATPAAPAPIALEPGGRITVLDTLTADKLEEGRIPEPDPRDRGTAPVAAPETTKREPPPLRRFYVAFAFSPRGTPGPVGTAAEFVLHPLPPAPLAIEASYTQTGVSLTWEPSGGLIGFLLDHRLPDEPPIEDFDAPEEPRAPAPAAGAAVVTDIPGPMRYLVYRELEPDPLAPPPKVEADQAWNARVPAQETPAPVPALSFADTPVMFERGRCYSVRSVRGVKDLVIGDASPPFCFRPVDVFPPAPPQQLAAVASEGAISLIWEPNTEPDLGGYLVLRGDEPDATLQRLTATPIAEARYRDATAKPGKRYVYTVIAVDNRLPLPNWSAESNRVEETAR